QHIAMADLDRFAFGRPPAIDADRHREGHHGGAKDQRKEAGTGQIEVAEIEQRGLPREECAGERNGGGDQHAAMAGVRGARQVKPARNAQAERVRYEPRATTRPADRKLAHFFFNPRSVISCASLASSLAMTLLKSSAGR